MALSQSGASSAHYHVQQHYVLDHRGCELHTLIAANTLDSALVQRTDHCALGISHTDRGHLHSVHSACSSIRRSDLSHVSTFGFVNLSISTTKVALHSLPADAVAESRVPARRCQCVNGLPAVTRHGRWISPAWRRPPWPTGYGIYASGLAYHHFAIAYQS